jgi:hypothetical protein
MDCGSFVLRAAAAAAPPQAAAARTQRTTVPMVVKLSANTLSWSQEFQSGGMDLKDMIEECYNLRLDGVSPAQQHIAEPDSECPRACRLPPSRRRRPRHSSHQSCLQTTRGARRCVPSCFGLAVNNG